MDDISGKFVSCIFGGALVMWPSLYLQIGIDSVLSFHVRENCLEGSQGVSFPEQNWNKKV